MAGAHLAFRTRFPLGVRLERLACPAAVVVLAGLVLLIRLPFLTEPFDTDEGGYALIARLWLDGQIPYRDVWDNKPPLTFAIYGAALALGGGLPGIRLAAALVLALTTVLLISLGREALDRRTGLLAGAIFAFSTALPLGQGTNANTEIFLLPGWIGAAWVFLVGLRNSARWTWPMAGAMVALAMLAKPVAGWLLPALLGMLLVLGLRRSLSWRRVAGRSAAIVAGCAAVLLPVGGYFAFHGALDDALWATVGFNRLYVARNLAFALDRYGLFATLFVPNRHIVSENPGLWLFGIAGLLSLPLVGRVPARTSFLLLWTLAAWLGAKTGWLELAHYYLQLIPALALWSAFYATRLVPLLARRRRWLAPFFAGNAVLLVGWSLVQSLPAYLRADPGRFHEIKFAYPDRGAWDAVAPEIAAAVAAQTTPGDTIFIWGREPQIYFYADRRPASRFIHDRPVWLDPAVMPEIRADLAERRPAIVLDTLDPAFFPEATVPVEDILPPGYRETGRLHYARVFTRE